MASTSEQPLSLAEPAAAHRLPDAAPRMAAAVGDDGRSPARRPLRILHAARDFTDHHMIRDRLSQPGRVEHVVRFAAGYEEALRCLHSDTFDLALVDAGLSGGRGLELIRRLGGRLAALPVVLLSGPGDGDLESEAIEAGAFDHLDRRDLTASILSRACRNACLRHEIEQDLRQREIAARIARVRAEQANQAKTDFLARISHDLRTPLNAILGFSEVIRDDLLGGGSAGRYREYANDIHESGQHLLSIINDLLDLSKIEAGKMELDEEPLDLVELAAGVIRMVEPIAQRGRVRLALRSARDLPRLRGDRQAISRMLLNLLSNAIRFTPERGRVTLEATHDLLGLHLIVQDSGVGIAPEEIHRVLQPFHQAQRVAAGAKSGTGLGLPIVNGLITLHGGYLSLESRLDQGTRVSLSFPRSRILGPDQGEASAS